MPAEHSARDPSISRAVLPPFCSRRERARICDDWEKVDLNRATPFRYLSRTYPNAPTLPGSSMLPRGLRRPADVKADGVTAKVGLRLLLNDRLGLNGKAAAVSGFGINRGPEGRFMGVPVIESSPGAFPFPV